MEEKEILEWIQGAAPSAQTVERLRQSHPRFLLPAAMRLRYAKDISAEERAELAARLALGAADPEQMAIAADTDLEIDLANFYPREIPQTPGTESAIEKFLNTYGTADPKEEALLERLIFNPTADYAQMLAREEEENLPQENEAPKGSQDDLINSFILKSKTAGGQFPAPGAEEVAAEPAEPQAPVQKPQPTDDSLLTESLAKIYIRRGNYSKAFEIISNLNLNFPEKSIYFADQLRFLSKLMKIEQLRQKTE